MAVGSKFLKMVLFETYFDQKKQLYRVFTIYSVMLKLFNLQKSHACLNQ